MVTCVKPRSLEYDYQIVDHAGKSNRPDISVAVRSCVVQRHILAEGNAGRVRAVRGLACLPAMHHFFAVEGSYQVRFARTRPAKHLIHFPIWPVSALLPAAVLPGAWSLELGAWTWHGLTCIHP